MAHKVFISWSGNESKRVADALREWLPKVMPGLEPWLSTVDIGSGARWDNEIAKQLQTCRFGIVCVTRGNLEAPWIFFEAGALSKATRHSFVCPYLIGVEPEELVGPLNWFQACHADKASTLQLLKDINERSLKESVEALSNAFDETWPQLERCLPVEEPVPKPALPKDSAAWNKLGPLEFAFLWGNLTDSRYDGSSIVLDRTENRWIPPSAIAGHLWHAAYGQAEFAATNQRNICFRPLDRVRSARVNKDEKLELTLELTMYLQFAATNLVWETDRELCKAVPEGIVNSGAKAWQPYLSSALNVIGCVVSQDDYLFTPRRGRGVFENPERYQASTGGFVERTDGTPAAAFAREVSEELAIPPENVENIRFLGFGYNEITGEPDLLVLADCRQTAQEMLVQFRNRNEQRKAERKPDELSGLFETAEQANAAGAPWKSVWRLHKEDKEELHHLFRFLRSSADWSQPSDRVAVIGAVCRKLGAETVLGALTGWRP